MAYSDACRVHQVKENGRDISKKRAISPTHVTLTQTSYASGKPHIIEAQELNQRILLQKVPPIQGLSVQDTSLSTDVDVASQPQSEVSRVMERVNRYVSLRKLQLARQLIQKELNHTKECSEILPTVSQLESSSIAGPIGT